MSSLPTTRASQTWQIEGGEDFLQLLGPKGNVAAWIDSGGMFHGAQGGSSVIPATKTLYVDNNRTDSYTPTGSISQPFLTIMAAVNQIAANGDNSVTVPYTVQIAAGTYTETVDLSNSALVNLTFVGFGAALQVPPTAAGLQSINNDNLLYAAFVGISFLSGNTTAHGINFTTSTNGTNLFIGVGSNAAPYGLLFLDCTIISSSGFAGTSDVVVQNAGGVAFLNCKINTDFTFNNVTSVVFHLCDMQPFHNGLSINTNGGNPAPSNWAAGGSQTSFLMRWCTVATNISVNAGSNSNIYWCRHQAVLTVNGTSSVIGSRINIVTVNSGGTYSERGSIHDTLTVNAGGTYSSNTSVLGTGALSLSGVAPTTPAGVVGLGNGTAATATAGAGSLPAAPAGFLVINVGGTTQKIPYYNS